MTSYFAPLRADNAEALALDMQSLLLAGRVLPFGAKLNVHHVFRSSEKSPVEVVYCFPLPRDASLVSFRISCDRFSISSRLERTADAQARYEQALENGSLAVLTHQNRDGLVNLTVGNLRPGETVSVHLELIAGVSLSDDGLRLRFPFTVAPCYHPQMRVSLDEPGAGTIELPDEVTGGVFTPPFHRDASHLHNIGFALQIDPAEGISEIASPSHPVRLLFNKGSLTVKLSPDQDLPNRDLVLDVKRDTAGDRKHFAMVVPSTVFGQREKASRKIVFLLDRSGSMEGSPLVQARHAIENCLAKLSPEDRFGIVTFDSAAERFRETLLPGSHDYKDEAGKFLDGIQARGGTELASGIEAAARLLGGGGGEIFIITDGQVAGTVDILRRARQCEIRLFCLGIGSASQDRFLELLARQTGGVCRFVTPAERVEVAASELFAALGGAFASDVKIANADTRPVPAGSVFTGTPFVALGEIDAQAPAAQIEWVRGSITIPFEPLADELQGFVEQLRGARLIADLEAHGDQRDDSVRQRLVEISERYGVTSSEMSLVAVVQRADDEGGDVPKTKIVPVGMPQHTQFDSYFGRQLLQFRHVPARDTVSWSEDAMVLASLDMSAKWNPSFALPFQKRLLAKLDTSEGQANNDLLSSLRAAIEIIERHVALRTRSDISKQIAEVLTRLVAGLAAIEKRVGSDARRSALSTLIDFISSDVIDSLNGKQLDLDNWRAIRQQLESAWPELVEVETLVTSIEPGREGRDLTPRAE